MVFYTILHYYYNTKTVKLKEFLRKSSHSRNENTIYSAATAFRDTKYGDFACQQPAKSLQKVIDRSRIKCYNKLNICCGVGQRDLSVAVTADIKELL